MSKKWDIEKKWWGSTCKVVIVRNHYRIKISYECLAKMFVLVLHKISHINHRVELFFFKGQKKTDKNNRL